MVSTIGALCPGSPIENVMSFECHSHAWFDFSLSSSDDCLETCRLTRLLWTGPGISEKSWDYFPHVPLRPKGFYSNRLYVFFVSPSPFLTSGNTFVRYHRPLETLLIQFSVCECFHAFSWTTKLYPRCSMYGMYLHLPQISPTCI